MAENCWHCKEKLIWDNDHDISDENDEYQIVTQLSCPKCNSYIEVYLPKKSGWEDENG